MTASTTDVGAAAPPRPSIGALFATFLELGLMGFGGVLPLSRRMLVERRRWLTPAEFTDLLGLCQFLPGGNVVNLSVAVGYRFRGAAGAVASIVGLIAIPSAVAIALGSVYGRVGGEPAVQRLFGGLAAAAAGLLLALAIRMVAPLRRQPLPLAVAGLCVVAIAVLRLPLLPSMAVLAALGTLAAPAGEP